MEYRSLTQPQNSEKLALGGSSDQRTDYFNFNRYFARHFKCNNTAIVARFFYLHCNKTFDDVSGSWCYKTISDFTRDLNIGKDKLRSILKNLTELGIIRTGNFNRRKSDRTIWYSLDFNAYNRIVHCEKKKEQAEIDAKKPRRVSDNAKSDFRQALPVDLQSGSQKEKNKQKEIIKLKQTSETDLVINHFNSVTGQSIKLSDRTAIRFITSCLGGGHSIEQIKSVITNQFKLWGENPDMQKYIRFATLCRARNFERYLSAVTRPAKKSPKKPVKQQEHLSLSEINSLVTHKKRLLKINGSGKYSDGIASIERNIKELHSSLSKDNQNSTWWALQ
ncbi:conserved phage C-terminal domain-containing protein [Aliivibrio fischeri]|uniref:conserved phage C-terminal domain-containing protein n=1 Tax=Aliivibrio fischeri TaxID=668 RepID=UPI001F42B77D|nr:conserved phage C-terminal domain-containing protein [Aliivibrio fischeri]MCE7567575.1 conserved phage C-terminal domain-containing protein [Aliivibrio fischeri]